MEIAISKTSKKINREDILSVLKSNYSTIGPLWISHQMDWKNSIYESYKDHDKFLIIAYLIKKTLDVNLKNFVNLSYDQLYSQDSVKVEKFNVIEIAKNNNIPKESARRKIIELEKMGIIKRNKANIIVDRSLYPSVSPMKSLKRISRFLSLFSNLLVEKKILKYPLSSTHLQKIIEKNYSYIWKLYYEMQIPMLLGYKNVFKDLETFHVYGTCVINQHLHTKIHSKNGNGLQLDRIKFIMSTYSNKNIQGINAMSISDITGIPRATVVRKLNILVKQKHLTIDDKKHYRITGSFVKELIPIQNIVLNQLAIFSTKIYNLVTL